MPSAGSLVRRFADKYLNIITNNLWSTRQKATHEKAKNLVIRSQCGHEYIISFFTTPEISLCTSSVNSADSLLVFSKERTCLQYGHFAICTSSYVCRENVYCHIYNFKPPNGSALSPFRCFCNGTRSRSHLVGSDCDIDNFQIAENETSSCWFFNFVMTYTRNINCSNARSAYPDEVGVGLPAR